MLHPNRDLSSFTERLADCATTWRPRPRSLSTDRNHFLPLCQCPGKRENQDEHGTLGLGGSKRLQSYQDTGPNIPLGWEEWLGGGGGGGGVVLVESGHGGEGEGEVGEERRRERACFGQVASGQNA